MTASPLNIADFAMDTASLAGSLSRKLEAVRSAGFSQVMLSAGDLVNHPDGVDTAIGQVKASGLRVTGLHALRDFDGRPGALHDHKIDVAKSLLEMCVALGCRLLLASSSTSTEAAGDLEPLARGLRKLAMLALPLGVRIGHQGLVSGRDAGDFNAAWDIVCRAGAPNLGLVIDSAHTLAAKTPLDDIEFLDADKVYLVQLADFIESGAEEERTPEAPSLRVFPGEGAHSEPLAELVLRLGRLGYRRDFSFDVANDDFRQIPPHAVANRARRAAIWLSEDVLHLSAPLPGRMRLRSV